jgi:hypothetical protein
MPQNQVSDPITDQEMAFAHLVLSGTMTDRRAAEAVGLNPDTAAYTKSKPRVRAYMLEHRAAVREQLVQQETEGLRQLNLGREQVLARLWEIANLAPEMTRSSITGQVKALAMIVAIQGLIPDHRAGSAEKQSAPPPPKPNFYVPPWLRERQARAAAGVQPSHDFVPDQDGPDVPDPSPGAAPDAPSAPSPVPTPAFDSSEFNFVHPSETVFGPAPDTRAPFSIKKKPFARRY